jgi:hypothetical protein
MGVELLYRFACSGGAAVHRSCCSVQVFQSYFRYSSNKRSCTLLHLGVFQCCDEAHDVPLDPADHSSAQQLGGGEGGIAAECTALWGVVQGLLGGWAPGKYIYSLYSSSIPCILY